MLFLGTKNHVNQCNHWFAVIWYQIFLYKTNNLHTIIWFKVTIPI